MKEIDQQPGRQHRGEPHDQPCRVARRIGENGVDLRVLVDRPRNRIADRLTYECVRKRRISAGEGLAAEIAQRAIVAANKGNAGIAPPATDGCG